jgi:RNA polymerase sigma factor (sigma-70 family)
VTDPSLTTPRGRTPAERDAFWQAYEPTLRRYARELLTTYAIPEGSADVADVVHETYANLHESWATVTYPKAFARSRARAFVFGVLREEKRRGRSLDAALRDDDSSANDACSDSRDPEDVVVRHHLHRVINAELPQALATLTPNQRTVLELWARGDLSREEIAAAIGSSSGAVSSHRARGLAKLASILMPLIMCGAWNTSGLWYPMFALVH